MTILTRYFLLLPATSCLKVNEKTGQEIFYARKFEQILQSQGMKAEVHADQVKIGFLGRCRPGWMDGKIFLKRVSKMKVRKSSSRYKNTYFVARRMT